MLDISRKFTTLRTAVAQATVTVAPETLARVRRGDLPKGDPLTVARVAAIQAAKNTSQIIPYCHPLPLDYVGVEFTLGDETIVVTTTVKAIHKTGVEMEALTAASVAALTLYDMLKALDARLEIHGVRLLAKRGGKSDFVTSFATPPRAVVLVLSDSVAAGEKEDRSGRLICERLESHGLEVIDYRVIADDPEAIRHALIASADERQADLVLTTGGTGVGPRDHTPEAMAGVIEREIPGIAEAVRAFGQARTPYAMLARGKAGVRGRTILVNLPGSRRGVAESLDTLFPAILHALKVVRGAPGHTPEAEEQGAA